MSVEFSEYHCKKKYRPRRHKFPLFRLALLFVGIFLVFKLGFAVQFVEMLPLPGVTRETPKDNWESRCQKYGGTPFDLKGGLAQCSWIISDSMPILPNAFLRYVASMASLGNAKLHWVAPVDDFSKAVLVQREDSLVYTYFQIVHGDSSRVWIDARTGCGFPGPCPSLPLAWSNIPISEDFDFEGQDQLLSTDIFLGVGEAPIHPILPGTILSSGRDSLGNFVEIDHGSNVISRMYGMASPSKSTPEQNANFVPGEYVDLNTTVGRLPPKDSAAFFLTIRRNGLFVRWNDFYKSSRPADSLEIANFKKTVGI